MLSKCLSARLARQLFSFSLSVFFFCFTFLRAVSFNIFLLKLLPRFAGKFSLQSAILGISASCGTEYKRVKKVWFVGQPVHEEIGGEKDWKKKKRNLFVFHPYQIQPSWSNLQFWIVSHLSVHPRISAFP